MCGGGFRLISRAEAGEDDQIVRKREGATLERNKGALDWISQDGIVFFFFPLDPAKVSNEGLSANTHMMVTTCFIPWKGPNECGRKGPVMNAF